MRLRLFSACTLAVLLFAGVPAAAASPSVTVAALVRGPEGLSVLRTTVRAAEADAAVARLERRSDVVAADVDITLTVSGADPRRPQQWELDLLRAETARAADDAAGEVIAVVDTGVDGEHPDLAGALVGGYSVFGPPADAATDQQGHGTSVAGIAAAATGNGVGISSLGGGASIMPVKVVAPDGTGTGSDVVVGILWAVENGADVINLSLGSSQDSPLLEAAVDEAADRGVVVVAASGNEYQDGNPTTYPAAYPPVIAVSAIGRSGGVADFSNRGAYVDVAAPGVDVLTTAEGGFYGSFTGTSAATPFVAAAAALLRARFPELSARDVTNMLQSTAADAGSPGHDNAYGYGVIDPVAALGVAPAPAPDPGPSPEPSPDPSPVPDPSPSPSPSPPPTAEQPQPSGPDGGDPPPSAPVTRVGDSPGATTTAIELSQAVFGDGEAPLALLSRDDSFADSLAGAALAGDAGPILYTAGGADAPLDPATAAELRRVLDPGATVVVLGGTGAVSEAAEQDVVGLGYGVRRIAGPSRIETALAIADAVDGDPERVLLARADEWADAVTGGAYAADRGLPVLLTPPGELHPAVAAYLDAHDPEVVLLGGLAALSDRVASAVGSRGLRVAGPNRAATAVEVARRLWGRTAGARGDTFIVLDGYDAGSWAPALAAAVLSADRGAPQLIANAGAAGGVAAETTAYLAELGYAADLAGAAVVVGSGVTPEAGETLALLLR